MNDHEDMWEPRAKCVNRPDLFALGLPPDLPRDDPEYPSRFNEWVTEETARYEIAEQYCLDCPVFVACRITASKTDMEWTTRGGVMPGMLHKATVSPAYKCKNAKHQDRLESNKLSPYCPTCGRNNSAVRRPRPTTKAAREALKAENKAKRELKAMAKANGHSPW